MAIQDITAAEISATTLALRFSVPPIRLVSDSKGLVNGVTLGREALSVETPYFQQWVEFWAAAADFGVEPIAIDK